MSETTPYVAIIILAWNQYPLTAACLRSLVGLDYANYRLIVVDNGSSDGTVEKLRSEFQGQIVLIPNGENLGFPGGNNVGIRYASEEGADYVMLLNNDTIADDPAFVKTMVAVMEDDPSVGLVSPSIFCADWPDKLWYAGARLSLWSGWKHQHILPMGHRSLETGYACGCCVLARVAMIQRIGLLPASYFLYMEDVEWSLRARQAGWRVVYAPAARLLHKVTTPFAEKMSREPKSSLLVYYSTRNRIWFVRQYGNFIQRWFLWSARIGCWVLCYATVYTSLRQWQKLRTLLCGVWDGLTKPPGTIMPTRQVTNGNHEK